MLRPLVNQPDIILFMATFGLTYILIGFGEIVFGGDPKVMIADQLYLPSGASIKTLGGFVQMQKIDIAAAIIASLMVAGLAVFFQKTRIGRALRAVADSHRAALSVGISLEYIWVMVWFAAGIVALATGIMWGARSDVSFALEIIALKALPVLILGGFTSIPGAIIGGIHHRRRREDRRILLGPAARQRHRGMVRLRDRAGVPAVPAARPVRRTNHRAHLSHVLPRSRPVQDELPADQALFPILQDQIGIVLILAVAFIVLPLLGVDFCSIRC